MPSQSLRTITLNDPLQGNFLSAEKKQALYDLSQDGVFTPANTDRPGPYDLSITISEGRLVLEMKAADGIALPALVLSVRPYGRLIRDYFMMIESYESMRRTAPPEKLEPIDMARRAIHDEGARLLAERLDGKVTLDHPTARRLFTLICALHGRDSTGF